MEVDNEFTRSESVKTLIETECPFVRKGEKNPELSFYERKLLFGRRFMEVVSKYYVAKDVDEALFYLKGKKNYNGFIGIAIKDADKGSGYVTVKTFGSVKVGDAVCLPNAEGV